LRQTSEDLATPAPHRPRRWGPDWSAKGNLTPPLLHALVAVSQRFTGTGSVVPTRNVDAASIDVPKWGTESLDLPDNLGLSAQTGCCILLPSPLVGEGPEMRGHAACGKQARTWQRQPTTDPVSVGA
jgi:hypothetical protein